MLQDTYIRGTVNISYKPPQNHNIYTISKMTKMYSTATVKYDTRKQDITMSNIITVSQLETIGMLCQ